MSRRLRIAALACAFTIATCSTLLLAPASGAARSVRGFDGSTITVGGFGIASQFANVPTGTQARIKRFNDTNEIKGIQLKYAEFADDKQDPATALSEARRLVTQVGTFAIVGDVSGFNPPFLQQQHVPYFGWAFDQTYCSRKIDTSIYGFGFDGCIVPGDPVVVPAGADRIAQYLSKELGKAHPTLTMFGNDTAAGKQTLKIQSTTVKRAGFDLVATNNQMGIPPVSDYTPVVQALLTSDNGKAPDVIWCVTGVQCINVWNLLQPSGFTGTYISSLYSDLLVKPMNGTYVNIQTGNFGDQSPGGTKMKTDLDAYQPGASAKLDTAMFVGWASADMFIQALKTVAKKGKSAITPEAVQNAAMHQSWSLEGVAGPTVYPRATTASYEYCGTSLHSDGTKWVTVVPYGCTKKQYVLPKG
jgi:ABC-type branched-subunit amino acid transport system substrate-binding protein